jgi:hypothetical protein
MNKSEAVKIALDTLRGSLAVQSIGNAPSDAELKKNQEVLKLLGELYSTIRRREEEEERDRWGWSD